MRASTSMIGHYAEHKEILDVSKAYGKEKQPDGHLVRRVDLQA